MSESGNCVAGSENRPVSEPRNRQLEKPRALPRIRALTWRARP